MRLRYELDNDEFAPASARRAIERDLGERIDATRLGTIRLIVSELVANSVARERDPKPIGLVLELGDDGTVRGEVSDGQESAEAVRESEPGFEPGATEVDGLAVVGALADRFGVEEGSARVWFELDPPGGG